ncbi:hypothetical protein B7494_g2694 [Chlorociboria aeruginascens]|nr:hypothetical protein B7494_g2694 [Chlorociboria aeruginascens]
MESTRTTTTTQLLVQHPEGDSVSPVCLTQQSILQVTLNGPGLLLTILAIIVSIQIFQPSLTCILLIVAPLPWIVHNDYVNFISLGPGGTPQTLVGYLKITILRMFALSDPYTPAELKGETYPSIGYYASHQPWLPKRSGPRPKIAGIAPQRQLDQPGSPKMYQLLRKTLERHALNHPDILHSGTSCFEKKGLALFARNPINKTCRGEICHVHHSDWSLHLNLHPDDAKVVLQNGWGERHPLARGGWLRAYVPREFVMIYAPRDRIELGVVCHIIEAASFWASGERLELKIE